MQSKDLIAMNLQSCLGMMLPMLEDMKDAPLTFPTAKGGNHPLWVVGHLAYSEGSLIQGIMLGEENRLEDWKEMFGAGSEPVADADKYPPYEEVLVKSQEVHQANLALLESMSEEDLDAPSKACPPGYENFFGTARHCFQQIANHWWMHQGQVADARRTAGRPPLMI